MDQNWKNDPKLAGVDKSKLDMLQSLADQGSGKNPADMLPFLLNAANQGKSKGLRFSSQEISQILEVLKMGKYWNHLVVLVIFLEECLMI